MDRHKDTLHHQILETLKSDIEFWESKVPPRDYTLMDTDRFRMVFSNFRHVDGKPHGLRLTYFGEQIMSRHFTRYKFETDYKANHKAMIKLDKHMIMPYYIGRKYVSFFGEDDASWFRLNDSNLNNFVEYLE